MIDDMVQYTSTVHTQVSKTMPNCTAARVPACVAMCVARHAHGELHQPDPHSRMLTHHDRSAVHMHMLYARHTTMRSRRCSGRAFPLLSPERDCPPRSAAEKSRQNEGLHKDKGGDTCCRTA